MSLTHKVNLEVKKTQTSNNEVGFDFRITGYENDGTTIDLTKYRIVALHNTPFSSTQVQVHSSWNSAAMLGTTGTFNSVIPDKIHYDSASKPPRRYDVSTSEEDNKYSVELNYHLSASGNTAAITADGGNVYDIGYRLSRANFHWFYDRSSTTQEILTGQTAMAKSYSYTNNTSYENNSSFILEYYDNGVWKKVLEKIDNNNTTDTNTGLYPYDSIYESAASKEHSIGVDTNYDHKLIIVSADTYIDTAAPGVNYGTSPTLSYYNNGSSQHNRGLFKFDVANNFTGETIQYAEMWNWINGANVPQNTQIECFELSAHWVDTTATYTNASNIFVSAVDSFSNYTLSNQQPGTYSIFDIPSSMVDSWKTETSNYGLGTKLNTNGTNVLNAYNTHLKEISIAEQRPRMVITFSDNADKVWHGYENTLWSNGNNWSTSSTPPDANETAFFDSTVSNNNCLLDLHTSVSAVSANAYTGSLNLSSYTLSVKTNAYLEYLTNLETSASTLKFTDTGVATLSSNTFYNLEFAGNTGLSGSNTSHLASEVSNNLTVGGTLNIGNDTNGEGVHDLKLLSGSTMNATNGIIKGDGRLYIVDDVLLDTTGTLSNYAIHYVSSAANVTVMSGDYSDVSIVQLINDDSTPHTFEFQGGIHKYTYLATGLGNNTDVAGTIVSLSANSPSVSASTIDIRNNAVTNHVQFFIGNTDFLCNIFNSNAGTKTISASGGRIILGGEGVVNNFMATSAVIETDLVFKDGPYIFYGTTIPPVMNEAVIKANNITVSGSSTNTPILNFLLVDTLSAVNDIIVSGGNTTFTNLQGSTLAAGNNIKFIGNSTSDRLNMEPSSVWYQNAGNKMWAWNAAIQNANASGGTSGFAAATDDLGSNVNWFFENDLNTLTTNANVVVDNTTLTSTTPITLNLTASDYETGITSAGISINLAPSIGAIVPTSFNTSVGNEITFQVEISAVTSNTSFDVTTINTAQLTGTDTFGPYTYNTVASSISFINSSPSYAINNDEINVLITAFDTLGFSIGGPNTVFYGEYDGQPVSFIDYNNSNPTTAVVRAVIPATSETLSGNLSISATNSIGTTFTGESSAVSKYYTVDLTPPEVTFLHSPTHQLDSNFVSVSATVTDNVGFNASSFDSLITDYYFIDLNGVTYPSPATSVLSANKSLLTSTNSLYSGYLSAATYEFEISATGTLYLTLKDLAGNITTCADSGYIVEPAIIFGTPSPSKSTPIGSNIVVPVSALGLFTDNRDNYYAKLLSANNDEVQLSWSNITSAATGVNTFNVTLSGNDQLFGSLVISGGHD